LPSEEFLGGAKNLEFAHNRQPWSGFDPTAMKTLPIFSTLFALLGISAMSAQAQVPNNEPVADVMAYTEDGKPFNFREETKGKYSVVVFGCLT
jgi:hypothetical protein